MSRKRLTLYGLMLLLAAVVTFTTIVLVRPAPGKSANQKTISKLTVSAVSTSTAIALENQFPGTTQWELDANVVQNFIQGYAGNVSANPGDSVPLYISTVTSIQYRLDVYRIGWYHGLGGRLMESVPSLQSQTQGYWTPKTGLVACPSCTIDSHTGLIEAHWKSSYLLHIGMSWLSGVYLVKISSLNLVVPAEAYIMLVVTAPNSSSAIAASLPVDTYQAYNEWGGWSLYTHVAGPGQGGNTETAVAHADMVSFDRPLQVLDFLSWDIHSVRWLERSGYDVSYLTDVDLDEQPTLVEHHRVFITLGHDEYWSLAMRNSLQAARDAGVSLAFFGADDAYWQIRYQPDSAGLPDHTIICYKVATGGHYANQKLSNDPMYPAHPEVVTSLWRDPVVNRPENALLGLMYESFYNSGYRPDWVVVPGPLDSLAAGTGLQPGEHIRGGLLGYEYDGVWNNGQTPPNLHILALSPVVNTYKEKQIAATAYYRAASGALVFDAGSIWWSWGLDDLSPPGAPQPNRLKGNQAIENLTANILSAMLQASPG